VINWFGKFMHNAIAHPAMCFLPKEMGDRFHDWTIEKFWPPYDADGVNYSQLAINDLKVSRQNIDDIVKKINSTNISFHKARLGSVVYDLEVTIKNLEELNETG